MRPLVCCRQLSTRSSSSRRSVRDVAVVQEPVAAAAVAVEQTRSSKANLHYETEQLAQQVLMVSDLHDPKVAIATAAVVSETNVDEEAVVKTRWVLGQSLVI